jgi:hypothetical protein
MMSVPGLIRLGARQSWSGVAEVRAQEMTRSSGAHARSLGKTVEASGICGQWPERAFRFTIGSGGHVLTITATGDHHRPQPRSAPGSGGQPGPARPRHRRHPIPPAEHPGRDRVDGTGAGHRSDADAFYRILDQLAAKLGGPSYLADCTGRSGCPPRGSYSVSSRATR